METRILKEFGLTQNETDIFLVLVRKGTLSATEVAKQTGLNRPYVYYALERLLEKGYISEITERGKKKFNTISLQQISVSEEHKLDILKSLISELEKIQKMPEDENISVEVLKGKQVIKNVFKKGLSEIRGPQEVYSIGIDEEKMEDIEPVYLKKILDHFKRNKVVERAIIKKGSKMLKYAKATRYRSIDPGLIGNTAKLTYQDTVIEIIYGSTTYAIITKNKKVAETERKQFEVFWKLAK